MSTSKTSTSKGPFSRFRPASNLSFVSISAISRSNGFHLSSESSVKCMMCGKDHNLNSCPGFLKLSTFDRFCRTKMANFCINCLKTKSHTLRDCDSPGCGICQAKYNILLHHGQSQQHSSSNNRSVSNGKSDTLNSLHSVSDVSQPSTSSASKTNHGDVTQTLHSNPCFQSGRVVLSTAIVLIRDGRRKYHECRSLLDSASTANYVNEHLRRS